MASSVKKIQIRDVNYYQSQFATIKLAAGDFENHERTNRQKLYFALQKIFEFGKEIAAEPELFEQFLTSHEMPFNKVTRENPYNALVSLAFTAPPSKSWHSECSNVLYYASFKIDGKALKDWLDIDGGIRERYKEAVSFFARTASSRAKRLRSSRLAMAKEQFGDVSGKAAVPGLAVAKGFYRSLVYSDGTSSYVVDIKEEADDAATEKYLLDLIGNQVTPSHPLADKPLFRLYRAIELICGLCGKPGSSEKRFVGLWNETVEGKDVTRVTILSDAHNFTSATVTLAEPLSALSNKGTFVLPWEDAEIFQQDFKNDDLWSIDLRDGEIWLANDATVRIEAQLLPFSTLGPVKLRHGMKPGRQSQNFVASAADMTAALSKNDQAVALFAKKNAAHQTPLPKPTKFRWMANTSYAWLEILEPQTVLDSSYMFMTFSQPTAPLQPHRHVSIADMRRLWAVLPAFGEDKRGYIADSDVPDAAYCLDDTFEDGDHLLYVSPLVGDNKKHRMPVCQDFTAQAGVAVTGAASAKPATRGSAKTAKAPTGQHTQSPAALKPASAARVGQSRDYQKIEKNRRAKTTFPERPSPSGRAFGAFITSYLPDNPSHRVDRKFDFEWQLEWRRRMTDIPVHVIASNWTDEEVAASKELGLVSEHGGGITRAGPRVLIENRVDCLKLLYASDFDWSIIMDDDAILMQDEHHNSSYRLFAEMAANGNAAYDGVDVFAPIYGRKTPFNKKLNAPDNPYAANHVFEKSTDLKGSMIVVRNFAKEGRKTLLPDPSFREHGEDTYFVLKALAMGYTTMTCWNMVLEEMAGASTFAQNDNDRTERMQAGHEQMVAKFGDQGLRLKEDSHLLDKRGFEKQCWGNKPKTITVAKPQ